MFKLIKNFKKKDWLIIIVSIALIVMQVWFELKMPDYMSKVTVLVQTEGSKMSEILKNGGYMLMCAFVSLVGAVIVGYLIALLASGFSRNLRSKLFRKVEDMSMSEIKEFSTNSLITRTTNDITQVEMFIGFGLQLIIKAPITAVWAITKILNKSWEWSMVTAVAVVILLLVIGILTIIVMPKFKIVQKLTDKLNEVTRENLMGIRVVRAFNAEEYQQEKFQNVNNSLTNLQLFNQKAMSIMAPVMYLVMYMLTLVIYFIGAYLIKDALMADKIGIFGNMVVFSSYAMQVIMSFLMLAMIFMILPRAQVSASRINEVLDTRLSVIDGNVTNKDEVGTVEFRNVSFKYPDAEEYVLRNISFKANKGDTVAFIGSTGSGKSTLVNLIVRFYDVTGGEILIDGVSTKDLTRGNIHDLFTMVLQDTWVFNGSIKDNIIYNTSDVSMEMVESVCKTVGLDHFIKTLPDGYNTILNDNDSVSAGQRQLLTIARGMIQNAPFLILDEATSNVDTRTEELVQKAMDKLTEGKTSFIIAHRLSTIKNADLILVMKDGNIIETGTHDELINKNGFYAELYNSQFKL